jgi:hypothetical protein
MVVISRRRRLRDVKQVLGARRYLQVQIIIDNKLLYLVGVSQKNHLL